MSNLNEAFIAHADRIGFEHAAMLELLHDCVKVMERGGKVDWAAIGEEYGLNVKEPDLTPRVIDAVREECRKQIAVVEAGA